MMKNLKTVLIIILSIVFLSCKKEPLTSYSLTGEWELTAEVNGLSGLKTNYEPGKGNVTKFTENTYEVTRGGKMIRKGTYSINTYQALTTKKEENRSYMTEKKMTQKIISHLIIIC